MESVGKQRSHTTIYSQCKYTVDEERRDIHKVYPKLLANFYFSYQKKESNFDAVHELEELLLDGEPLRPRKRASKSTLSDAGTLSEAARARQYLEEKFLPFDCTKQESWGQYHHHSDSIESETNSSVRSTVTAAGDESRLLRRIGGALNEHIDNVKYRGQGYMPAPVEMDEDDDTSITRLSTKTLVDKTV